MRAGLGQREGLAAAQQPAQLYLGWRAAHLGDDRGGDDRDDPGFQAYPVIGPGLAGAAVGRRLRTADCVCMVKIPQEDQWW